MIYDLPGLVKSREHKPGDDPGGLVFGLRVDIGACGWAVVRHPAHARADGHVLAMGCWAFDVPETDKEGFSTNEERREFRLQRRVVRRRAQRLAALRRHLASHDISVEGDVGSRTKHELCPWALRAKGLDCRLTPSEFCRALVHIAKRRGYRPNSATGPLPSSEHRQKMLQGVEAVRKRLTNYRTVGELFARDPAYSTRKRNRDGIFDRTQYREDLICEVMALFQAQRRLGNGLATTELATQVCLIAFDQRPLQGTIKLIRLCPFEKKERRSARHAPTFEKMRLLARLNNLRIKSPSGERNLLPREIGLITRDLGRTARLSGKAVRQLIGMADDQRFTSVGPDDEGLDIVTRGGESMYGTKKLRDALGEVLWADLLRQPHLLDRIADVLSFYETQAAVHREIDALALPGAVRQVILAGVASGHFAGFRDAGHISATAARRLVACLENGLDYYQACQAAGYSRDGRWADSLQVTDKHAFKELVADMTRQVANPVTQKVLAEALKQIWAMRHRWGLPDMVRVELAREVGHGIARRNDIRRGIKAREGARQKQRNEARNLTGLIEICSETLLRYRLWQEQGGVCPLTGHSIPPAAVVAADTAHAVAHILPLSRFADDSYANKIFCRSEAARLKAGLTPHEWIMQSQGLAAWKTYVARIEASSTLKAAKMRNHLFLDAAKSQDRLRLRNMRDDRFAARLLSDAIEPLLASSNKGRTAQDQALWVCPGAMMASLRRAWGLEALKPADARHPKDKRVHALDALALATLGRNGLEQVTREMGRKEQVGLSPILRNAAPPWGDLERFQAQARAAFESIAVARSERRRARGGGHAASIRQVGLKDGQAVLYERKTISDLPEKRLDDIKDPQCNQAVVRALRQWIASGRPANQPPLSPAGDVIRKVRLKAVGRPAVQVRGGSAARGDMIRVDVYARPGKRGPDEFYLVPIYPHQVMNRKDWPQPPNRAVVAGKDEATGWVEMDSSYTFKFSLYRNSFVTLQKKNGDCLEGYFAAIDRTAGSLNLFSSDGSLVTGIGAKRLVELRKYEVDRLGCRVEVTAESRVWHGQVCR